MKNMKKMKCSRKDDFLVICKVPVDIYGYNVNGKFYKTLEEAASECGVSSQFLSMVLNQISYSSRFDVYRDMITEYREEKHRFSYALSNMYEIVVDETFDLMSKDWLENNFLNKKHI